MTIAVTGPRSNKRVTMDIEQLRGSAAFMERAIVASLIATLVAGAALGITTWLSFRFSRAVFAHEYAAIHLYKVEVGEHIAALKQEVSRAHERAYEFEQAAAEANARAAQAASESATGNEKARTAEVGAEELRNRVAELGKQLREATARAPAPDARIVAAEPPPAVTKDKLASESDTPSAAAPPLPTPPSPIVASLKKYAGTKAAVYVLAEASDAPAVGATISGYLGDAGWAPLTWTWTGVSGILGVTVLIKDGNDPVMDEAASAVLDALRSAGFNAAKGNWPADWRSFRGALSGPQTAGPTEAPIRIVVGSKAR
ncbi:hypothetical protein SAMN02990966_08035 [Rhodospirillales bacterium URHD0017]|nr:hypothetical protein SAMN02990966_08035 [Rhodospirillales bacterium URHD0017]